MDIASIRYKEYIHEDIFWSYLTAAFAKKGIYLVLYGWAVVNNLIRKNRSYYS